MNYRLESLKKHKEWHGKIETKVRVPVDSREALSLAYTPGVAEPCLAIKDDPEKSFELMEKRQGTSGDIHEKDRQYLEKCRSNALDISRRFGWRRVDCVRGQEIRTPEDISHEVLSAVKEVLAIE